MTIDIHHDQEADIIVVTVRGPMDAEAFANAMRTVTSSPSHPPDLPVLCDASGMDFDGLDRDFVASSSHAAAPFLARRPHARSAYVCPGDLGYGVLRLLLTAAGDTPGEREVFRTQDAARRWLAAGRAGGS